MRTARHYITILIVALLCQPITAGTIVLTTNTLERASSGVTIIVGALNLKTHVNSAKKAVKTVFHKRAKKT